MTPQDHGRISRVREAFAAVHVSTFGQQPSLPSPREAAQDVTASLQSLDLEICKDASTQPEDVVLSQRQAARGTEAMNNGERPSTHHEGTDGTALPLQIENATVNRAQARQRFLDLHFGTSSLAPYVFVYEVFNTDYEQQIVTTAAVDTMCVAQMATSFQDPVLMETAGVMYSRVARAISRRLRRLSVISRSGCLDDLFGGIHALITCGFFSGLNISPQDREQHVQGLENMTRVISNEQMSVGVKEAFKHKWGRQGFWLAIKQRKHLCKVDCRIDFVDRWRITDSESLSRLACEVPSLLERADELSRRPALRRVKQEEVLALLTELEATTARLKKWQSQWEAAIPVPYHLRSTRSFEAFRGISGQYFEVFKTAYAFSNPANERDFRVLQICLLSLDLTIVQLHKMFRRLLIDAAVRTQLKRAEFGAELAAEALCM